MLTVLTKNIGFVYTTLYILLLILSVSHAVNGMCFKCLSCMLSWQPADKQSYSL